MEKFQEGRRPPSDSRKKHLRVLLDGAEVATVLRTTPRHVRRLVEERRIPFVKVGRFIRFDPDDVEAWLISCRVGAIERSHGRGW
jgi:excisionase family DNA binding protein